MGWKKLVILLLFATTGCNVFYKNYYRTEDSGIRPKKSKFKLAEEVYHLKKNDIIDTNSVYIYRKEVYRNEQKKIEEYFYRFFSDGKCIRGFSSNFKSNQLISSDFNNLARDGSFIGYYKIEDGVNLVTETFSAGVGENGKYNKEYGIVKGDTIFLFNSATAEKKTLDTTDAKVYIRKTTEKLTGTPDW